MVDYCHTPNCLRAFILSYFGDKSNSDECGKCGNCCDNTVKTDITIEAQKVFSCIYRMRERFGMVLVAEVLKGSKSKRILELGLNELSTYGIMAGWTLPNIRLLIQRLISTNYLQLSEGEYPVVKLTPIAMRVLKNEEKVWQKLAAVPQKAALTADAGLFEQLRQLRRAIAARENVPPFVVFADSVLKAMSEECPTTPEEMLKIKGVGEVKMRRYGAEFLAVLKNR